MKPRFLPVSSPNLTTLAFPNSAVARWLLFLVPAGHKSVPLFRCGVGEQKYQRRRGVVVEEPLLEFGCVPVNLHLVRDALCNTQPVHERVQRVELRHHEYIIHRDGHCEARIRDNVIVRIAEIRCHLHPLWRDVP